MTRRTAFRTCPLCEATCGLELTIDDERVTRTRGDRLDVFSHGFICPKGSTLGDLHEDPDRLRTPVVKRNGSFEPATWEEAMAFVKAGLRPFLDDRQAIGVYLGNPNVHNLSASLYNRPFLRSLGTRNIFSASTVDQMPRQVSCGLMFGHPLRIPVPDIDRTSYLLMLGANPYASNGSLATAPDWPGRMKAIQDRGGRIVVIDPKKTKSARAADEHLFIRPGSDPYFLFGLLNVLFADGLTSELGDLYEGLDTVAALADRFPPEAVATRCGIDADTIRRIAHELAAAPTAVVYGRIGTHTTEYGTLASWLTDVLTIVTGNFDAPGGAMFPMPAILSRPLAAGGRGFRVGRWTSRVRSAPETMGELPVAVLAEEITTPGEGQIRAMITIAGNPVLSTPAGAALDEALAQLDFMVSFDPYINETTRHADVILPPPSALERSHFDVAFTSLSVRNVANYSPPVFERPAGVRDEWESLAEMAAFFTAPDSEIDAKGADEMAMRRQVEHAVADPNSAIHGRSADEIMEMLVPRSGPERILDFMLRTGAYGDGFGADADGLTLATLEGAPHGIDLGALQPRLPEVLETPTGLVEMAPDPITRDVERLASDLEAPQPDLVLIGRRHVKSNNSWMHNVEILVRGRNTCTLQIHPSDAAKRAVVDGAVAKVTSRVGAVEVTVEVTDDLMPGVVSIPHGWGHGQSETQLGVAARYPGINSNVLTDHEILDPLSGNAVLNGIPVEVAPVG